MAVSNGESPIVIVCLCRNINQARVLEAIEAGAENADDVHRHHGVDVNCGCCLDAIDDMIGCSRLALQRAAE